MNKELNLYKSKVVFISIAIHHENVINQSSQFMKKTLTQMYSPNKSKDDEKEGELYKQVQTMIITSSQELDIIWKFIYGRSLTEIKPDRLARIANMSTNVSQMQMDPYNTSIVREETSMSESNSVLKKDYKLFNDSLLNDSSSEFGQNSIESGQHSGLKMAQVGHDSTRLQTFMNQSHGTILQKGLLSGHVSQMPIGSFSKNKPTNTQIVKAENCRDSIDRNVLKDVLLAHAKVKTV